MESADGRVATAWRAKGARFVVDMVSDRTTIASGDPPSFLAGGWLSGPRRQGFAGAAQDAPLTAAGRSQDRSARKEGGF